MSEQAKSVVIYSTPTCHFCHMAKDFLTENKIEFTDYNVAEDSEKRDEMIQKSGQMGVPVIFIGDKMEEGSDGESQVEMIIGFDQAKISELLAIVA